MAVPPEYQIREATLADVPLLFEARRNMFVDLGEIIRPEDLDTMDGALADFIAEHADSGPIGFIAADSKGELAGAVSVTFETVQPSLHNLSGCQAYLSGMWVRRESRRQGLARSLVATAVEAARVAGAGAVTLMASDEGRRVYSGLGFVDVPAMRLSFNPLFDFHAHGGESS
jgi:GNAT superfamily N-acetyltransferase